MAERVPGPERLAALREMSPPMLWRFADLFQRGGKRVALLQVRGFAEWLPDADSVADFNRAYFPHARIVMLDLPEALFSDGMHLNASGAAAAARALWRERTAFEGRIP
jgi:hypothetical protein